MRNWLVAFVGGSVLLACTTAYQPMPGPELRVTQRRGGLVFVKNGETTKSLVEATAEVPPAQAAARRWTRKTRIASVLLAFGGSSLGGSRLAEVTGYDGVSVGLAIGGIVSVLTGVTLMASGQADLWDALNTYNDSIATRGSAP